MFFSYMELLLLNELIPWSSRHFPFLRATCPDLSESGPRSATQRHCVWRSASDCSRTVATLSGTIKAHKVEFISLKTLLTV